VEASPEAAAALKAAGIEEWVSTRIEEVDGQTLIAVGVTSATEKVASAVRAALAPLPVKLHVEERPDRY
jgi:hypothetical protein